MKIAALLAVTALTFAGCAMSPQVQTHRIGGGFDEAFAQNQIKPGEGQIEGTAFLRQRGGGVVTCAGQEVRLVPVTDYGRDRLISLYGAAPSVGQSVIRDVRISLGVTDEFIPDIPEYYVQSRETKCDGQGNFHFPGVKDGDYYIVTAVVWQVRTPQGGSLATKVSVMDGKSPRVIITK